MKNLLNPIFIVLLFFIFVQEAISTAAIRIESYYINPDLMIYALFSLQIVFAPLQAGLSDYYCRRKSLIIAFSIIMVGLVFLFLSFKFGVFFLILFIVCIGIGGNVLPIARAGIGDIINHSNFRFALAISICAIALGSFGILYLNLYLSNKIIFLLIIFLCLISLIFAIFTFKDIRDRDKHERKISFKDEIFSIYHKFLKNRSFVCVFFGYMFAETSFFQILFREEVLNNFSHLKYIPLELGVGYYIGTVIVGFLKGIDDKKNIIIGIFLSSICIWLLFVFSIISFSSQILFIALVLGYSCGFAIFIPGLFCLITRKEKIHDFGKMFGLIDSCNSCATLIAFSIVLLLKEISVKSMWGISIFFLICSAFLFYKIIKKCSNTG